MHIVEARDITKVYLHQKQEVRAVNGVSFDIKQGEFTVIAGPSGSGKTTILNIIGAMDSATSGRIVVGERDITELPRGERADFRRERVGFIFQNYNLIPILSVYENVEFALDLSGEVEAREKRGKILQLLSELGLSELGSRRPSELSSGQQQRVAIARALIKDPILILADEPTANLDTATGEEVVDLMERINRERKTTFIFSSHDPLIIQRARRVIRVRDGRIEKDDSEDGL